MTFYYSYVCLLTVTKYKGDQPVCPCRLCIRATICRGAPMCAPCITQSARRADTRVCPYNVLGYDGTHGRPPVAPTGCAITTACRGGSPCSPLVFRPGGCFCDLAGAFPDRHRDLAPTPCCLTTACRGAPMCAPCITQSARRADTQVCPYKILGIQLIFG